MQRLIECPVCKSDDLAPFLSCKDYTVSHETFKLDRCGSCGFVLTNPRPDEQDLPRYYQSQEYVSHSNNSPGIINKIYRLARNFTLKWKYQTILNHSINPPVSLLDFGCGTGAFLTTCQQNGIRIAGIEPSPIARDEASKTTNTEILADISQSNETFDVITLWHVLEHVPDFHQTLEQLKLHLSENGTMFIAVPNLESSDARKYRNTWAGYDVPRHIWHFSRKTMETISMNHNLKIINVLPMRLDAYYVSLLSEKYEKGRTDLLNMITAFFTAWNSNTKAKHSNEYSSLIYIIRK